MHAICGQILPARHATYLAFLDQDNEVIDRGIALFFPSPHSYTGEHILELQAHGGPMVLQLLLRRCLDVGAAIGLRLAQPGEFTQRAYLNNKLDLAQAEAVADLIEAGTERAVRSAARSLSGVFSRAIHDLVDKVTHLRMLVEATLDFPEEEIDFLTRTDAQGQLTSIHANLNTIMLQAKQGVLLREGVTVVLAGQPNVGKSSLLNLLAGEDIAIVTPIAGTTRDQLKQSIQLNGIPLHIIDTAGLRESEDEVERIGIARSWESIARADVVLHLRDATQPQMGDPIDLAILSALRPTTPVLQLYNKIDLLPVPLTSNDKQILFVSAKTGEGMHTLREQLLEIIGWQEGTEGLFSARARHIEALDKAATHFHTATTYLHTGTELDLLAEELRLGQIHLSYITGEFTSDDLLGVIFSRFCIGK